MSNIKEKDLLDEDSICFGCEHYIDEEKGCNSPIVCVEGSMNDFNPQYSYFVSYSHNNLSGHGFGMTNVKLKYPIRSFDDLVLLRDLITKERNIDNVIILNYHILEQ